MRGVRDSQGDLWGTRAPRSPGAPSEDRALQDRRQGGAGETLARALTGIAHLPSHLASIDERLGRIEAGMDHLRRALPPLLVTLPEAARALRVSYATIRRMKKAGRLPLVGTGRSARVDLLALHAPSDEGIGAAARTGLEQREDQEDDDATT